MFVWVRPDAVLELVHVALVCQVEVRPRHEARGFHLALSYVLQQLCSYCSYPVYTA